MLFISATKASSNGVPLPPFLTAARTCFPVPGFVGVTLNLYSGIFTPENERAAAVYKMGLPEADGTKYEASYSEDNHVHQVCTICGKVTEIVAPQVTAAVKDIRMQRFRKDAYALYIYGVCSGCQSKMTRKRKKE